MLKHLSVFIILCILSMELNAQADTAKRYRVPFLEPPAKKDSAKKGEFGEGRSLAFLMGIAGGRYISAEIGLSVKKIRFGTHHAFTSDVYVANEFLIGDNMLIGPKVGAHIMAGMAMGASVIYYTDFNKGSLVFRPDVGVGLFNFKMSYGCNFRIVNTSFGRINRHLANLIIFIKLKKLKD